MTEQLDFAVAVSQNEYLSLEDKEIHAILTVTAGGLGGSVASGPAPQAAEVIAVDCSGSMSYPPTKISAARNATVAAIDALRDGVFFAVVEGNHVARMAYPGERRLVAATPETKNAAKKVVRHLDAAGGTAMGQWLRLADELLMTYPAAIRHVMLLTDGQNLPEHAGDLDEALQACAGRFVCDGRGIGDDYSPDELQRIVSTLRGSADAIMRDSELVADFAAMMRVAMSKVVPDVRLLIRPMPFARMRFLKQKFPGEVDLTGLGTPVDAHTTAFSTGSWSANEEREFHICLDLHRADLPLNTDIQAARVDLAIAFAGSTQAQPYNRPHPVRVRWTDDVKLSSVLNPKVAHYTVHSELAAAMKTGRDALDAGDLDLAAGRWGRAVALATELGHTEMVRRLGRLVDIVGDPADGVVRVKANLRPREIFSAFIESVRSTHSPTARLRQTDPPAPGATGRVCPKCCYHSPPTARFCAQCQHALGDAAW